MKPDPEDLAEQRLRAREVATIVDPLIADVWGFIWSRKAAHAGEEPKEAPLAILLRMAYLQGYGDALVESERGEVFGRLGVEIPGVKKPPRPASRLRRLRGSLGSSGT